MWGASKRVSFPLTTLPGARSGCARRGVSQRLRPAVFEALKNGSGDSTGGYRFSLLCLLRGSIWLLAWPPAG